MFAYNMYFLLKTKAGHANQKIRLKLKKLNKEQKYLLLAIGFSFLVIWYVSTLINLETNITNVFIPPELLQIVLISNSLAGLVFVYSFIRLLLIWVSNSYTAINRYAEQNK